MSKIEKLITRFKSVPADLTWDEFIKFLSHFGYKISNGTGSKRKFINHESGHTMSFHEPHPQSIMKKCYIREVITQFDDKQIWIEQNDDNEQ